MSIKHPYPESYTAVHHRSPRVATLSDGRIAALSEPGFEVTDEVRLHLCDPAPAREGLAGEGLTLVGPERATFGCHRGATLVAGVWCDARGRLIVAWSDGHGIFAKRTRGAVDDIDSLASLETWEALDPPLPETAGTWHLGSGRLDPRDDASLWLVALALPQGRIALMEAGGERPAIATLHAHPLNHTPTLAIDPDGQAVHVVWDTEDLRILHRSVALDRARRGSVEVQEPFEVWWYCHHPDVATNGREVIVAYTTHMLHISYSYFDGREWRRNLHLSTLHPRFLETLEHSPWLWTDDRGLVHLSFVCLTRRLAYDAAWLGEGFADPQPVEGLFHPSLFNDDVRVRAERMSLDRGTGTMLLSSSFLPERHGLYAANVVPSAIEPDQPILFLDQGEVAELRGLTARLETMKHDPAEPVFEPTEGLTDFDGARVLNNGTVLEDAGRYRMWYSAVALETKEQMNWYDQVYVGYAESDDGVQWRRVATGAGGTFRGRPAPNLVRGVDHNACVFIDPEDAPARRYKAIKFESRAQRHDHVKATGKPGYMGLPRRGWLSTSADGIRWHREEVTVDFPGPEPYGFQPQKALYDPVDPDPNRRYKVIGFTSLAGRRRCASMGFSPDCAHWTVAERSPALDSMAAVCPVRPAGPFGQIHDASMARYGRYLFALYQNQFDGKTADVRLAVSRDNERFTFVYPETPLAALGESGAWNSGYMMPVDLVAGDEELWLYYGTNSDHDGESPGIPPWRVCAGRAVARRDRFVAISPKDAGQEGRLVTIPFTVADPSWLRLEVNARVGEGGALRVGLTDVSAQGRPVPGFGVEECRPIRGDSICHRACWGDGRTWPRGMRTFGVECVLLGSPDDSLYSMTLRRLSDGV